MNPAWWPKIAARSRFSIVHRNCPDRLIEPERDRINVGIPARMPAAVVPAPPWWTTARHAGKTAASSPVHNLDMVGMLDVGEVIGPRQINARSPNCAQAALIMATVSAGDSIDILPKPK